MLFSMTDKLNVKLKKNTRKNYLIFFLTEKNHQHSEMKIESPL
jgi:hypothetical protein